MDLSPSGGQVYTAAIILGTLSGLTLVLDTPTLIWHAKHRNVAISALVIWTMQLNLFNFVNAILWPNDDITAWRYNGIGLCDIQVKLILGSSIGLGSALLAILRNLANVLDTENRPQLLNDTQRRREKIIEWTLVLFPPIFLMLLHVLVQPSRYLLWGISGCIVSLDESWLALFIVEVPTLIVALADGYMACLLLWRIHKYHKRLSSILVATNSNKSRFARLASMAVVFAALLTPFQIFVFVSNVQQSHFTAYSWATTHLPGWSREIDFVESGGRPVYDSWARLACGALVFLFFGMSADARALYGRWLGFLGLGTCCCRCRRRCFNSTAAWRRRGKPEETALDRSAASGRPMVKRGTGAADTFGSSGDASSIMSEASKEHQYNSPHSADSTASEWRRQTVSTMDAVSPGAVSAVEHV